MPRRRAGSTRPPLAARVLAVGLAAVALVACSGSDGAASVGTDAPATTAPETTTSEPTTSETTAPGTTAPDAATAETDAPPTTDVDASTSPAGAADTATLIAERPVDVIVPDGLDPDAPAPLVVVLHGYSGTGALQDLYFGFRDEAARRGVILVHPDGTEDPRGMQFWNATEACCNFFGSQVDDVAYLTAVVDHVRSIHPVDPARVFLAGHSNGGFMSYRMACERADLFAAVVSLAGAMVDDDDTCAPSEPVSVVQVHGTVDDVIRYEGGDILGNPYPSAAGTTGAWAALDGCGTAIEAAGPLDLETELAGDETTVARSTGCPAGVGVELWTIPNGSHLPRLGAGFATAVFDFFEAHPDE